MREIAPLPKGPHRAPLLPLCHVDKSAVCGLEEGSHQNWAGWGWGWWSDLGLQPPEPVRNTFLLFIRHLAAVLCHSSPFGPRLVPWKVRFQQFANTGAHGEGTRVRRTRQASECWTMRDCE